jgi:hypothetical protein
MNRCLWIAALLLLGPPLLAGEAGVIVRDAPVYAAADSGARQVGKVGAGTRVNIFSRRGGWEEIFAEQENLVGWVRSYQVRGEEYAPRVETGAETDSRGFLSGLAAFSRKASRFFSTDSQGSSSGTATIGVRGLSEEEIDSAKPAPAELRKMQGFASNPQRMARFQLDGQLSANQVKHLKIANRAGDKKSRDK